MDTYYTRMQISRKNVQRRRCLQNQTNILAYTVLIFLYISRTKTVKVWPIKK